jgi:hypothetical protein
METVTREEASVRTAERVGPFMLTLASSEPSPHAAERWGRRAEVLANWLVGEWRRAQGQVEGMVSDGQRRSDEGGDVRRCDLN